jgi:tetratricopeptide (TPR) repeat protein
MKHLPKATNIILKENNNTNSTSLRNLLVVFALTALLFGCNTTAQNIKFANELGTQKLLTGRFVFYNHELPLENDRGFTIFFKEKFEKPKTFKPDYNGYVYIPVDEGQYYIESIRHNSFAGGVHSIDLHQSSGINVDTSDTVVNFGTIKVILKQNLGSKVTRVLSGVILGSTLASDLHNMHKPMIDITQITDYNANNQYISSKFNIAPGLIRDEIVNFSSGTRGVYAKSHMTKPANQYSSRDLYFKGRDAFSAGNYSAVVSYMTNAIDLGQGDIDAYYDCRGDAFCRLYQYEKAIEDYNKSIELNPKNIAVYLGLIETCILAEKYESAYDTVRKTVPLKKPIKEKALLLYFECMSKKLLNIETSESELAFSEIIKKRFATKRDFNEIEIWLSNSNIDNDTKTFIKKKTELIKKH